MKISLINGPKTVMSNPTSKHNYFAWPTVARLKNGRLAVVASGFRIQHVCPFGKTVLSFSEDEGKTYTRPAPVIAEMAENADLFVCEGMFGENEKLPRAKESGHMTFSEAAALAQRANPKNFWLTHFSPSMPAPMAFADNARRLFPGVRLGADGDMLELRFEEE